MRPIALLILFCLACSAQAASHYVFSNPPGPHPVGVSVVQQYDYARAPRPAIDSDTGLVRKGELARPVQTLVWYPAQAKGVTMRFGDYYRSAMTENDFSLDQVGVERAFQAALAIDARALGKDHAQAELARPMWARRDALPAAGKFPLVIYAPGHNGSAHENVELCEYLASQGYVVMASPSIGARGVSMEISLEGAETQAADIGFLIGYAHSLPNVDMDRIAVAGYSWGGLANVLAAARDQRIRALVALDGSVRGFPEYVNGGKDAAKYATAARVALPLLYLSAEPKTIEEMEGKYDMSFSFINAMKYADVYYMIMHPMQHAHFSTHTMHFEGDDAFADYTRAEVGQAHSWATRYVLEFLNAYLKQDVQSKSFLGNAPAKNNVPAHMVSTDIRLAKASTPTVESFAVDLRTRGFDHAVELYQARKQAGAPLQMSEKDLNSWGYRLMRMGRPKDGLEIFKLMAHVYPDSGDAQDSLAEGYATNGMKAEAIIHYRRSLALDPKNTNAEKELKALGATP